MPELGTFAIFEFLSLIKKDFVAFFIKLIISASALFKKPSSSQINLIKNAKIHFLFLKKLKNTKSAQLWVTLSVTENDRLNKKIPQVPSHDLLMLSSTHL